MSSIGTVDEVLSLIVFLQLTGTLILNVHHGWSASVCISPSAAHIVGLLSCVGGYSSYISHLVVNFVVYPIDGFGLLCA